MKKLLKIEDYLSIGELSKQTGIGVHTLRVWEKRYGAPLSERLPSGHRRYPKEEVPRLKAIARALESGYRASKVVTGTLEELQGLLGAKNFMSTSPESTESEAGLISRELTTEKWIEAIHQYDEETLSNGFYETWSKEGPLNFILDFSVPLVGRIGNGWANGELTVGQEHFATAHLGDFLSSKWRQLNVRKDGPIAVLSTLPEETHSLGLLMCAVVTSMADLRVVYLGPNSPVEDILKTTEHCGAQLLCLSISNCVQPKMAKDQLKQIRNALDKKTNMIIGGEGALDAAPGIYRMSNFSDYFEWISQLNI